MQQPPSTELWTQYRHLALLCEQYEDKAPDTVMSSCWQLLGQRSWSVAAGQGIGPGKGADYIEALLQAR